VFGRTTQAAPSACDGKVMHGRYASFVGIIVPTSLAAYLPQSPGIALKRPVEWGSSIEDSGTTSIIPTGCLPRAERVSGSLPSMSTTRISHANKHSLAANSPRAIESGC
jgi:hypothetical protein